MKINHIILSLGMLCCFAMGTQAQDMKVGTCNVNFILSRMPETATMNTSLQTYGQKLQEKLQSLQQAAQVKIQEYQDKAEAGATEAELKPLETEIQGMEENYRAEASKSQQQLADKRATFLKPISEKVNNAIKSVAEENSYDYILNATDGSGVSIAVFLPEENNITLKVLQKLGINTADLEAGK